jgi:hypothetical protein
MFMCRFLENLPTTKIYKCRIQQSRRTCVALYLEDKYEELAVEAHFDYKRFDNLISNQPSFQCKFYKVCMKDKNIFSYHRMMNWCSVYNGKKLLKKYPT